MVLYDNEANFLAISDESIRFLGYDDANDFKKYVNDVADLFVVKSGYVYKFKNFSWIDYILHSGAANKSAIIKLKNGREKEVDLHIKEVYFPNSSKDDNLAYEVILIDQEEEQKQNSSINPNHELKKHFFSSKETTPIQTTQQKKPIKLDIGMKALGININTMNNFVKEYLKYAEIVDKKMMSAINWRSSNSITKIAIELKSVSDLLRIDILSQPLILLLEAVKRKESQEELNNTYKKYKEALRYTKETLFDNVI